MPGLSLGDDSAGLRLNDAVDHILAAVEQRDLCDVVLVGHSWGRIPITGAAHRLGDRLAALAYFSALIPRRGESMATAIGPLEGFIRDTVGAAPDGTIGLDFPTFQQGLMPGEPEPLQRFVFDQLMPQTGGYMLDAPGVETLGRPVTYVLGEDEISQAAPGVELAARVGVRPMLVAGGHEALPTSPEEVAKTIVSSRISANRAGCSSAM
jgi:pimeloyl-ACP methyl ester carboxylesterase